jgi:hypothetical protein
MSTDVKSEPRSFRTSRFGDKKRPLIDAWEIGTMFGVPVVRGYVSGEQVTTRIHWWANNRFGVGSGNGTDVVFKVGRPNPRT